MDYEKLLNKEQLAAVESKSQYLRIIAGAGSGKTRVLTYRISYLIGEMNVDPHRILAFAFTNKVAKEMGERAGRLVSEQAPFLHVSTFHSFCSSFLRMEHDAVGYPRNYTIMDEDDQSSLVKDVAAFFHYKKSDPIVKMALSYIRNKKCAGKYPEDINVSRPQFEEEKECLKFFQEYETRKTAMFCFDFDDLLLQTIKVLLSNPNIHYAWSHRFDHILVDEFQDTNDVQYKLLKLLINDDTCIYVVGDPDQTIYTWRGANQNIILGFVNDFKGAETVVLDRNYRSTKNILDGANKLISHNKKRVPKNLFTVEEGGEPISAKRLYSSELEAKWVVDQIQKIALSTYPADYSHIAVLYRSSYVTRPFEAEFASRGIPYRIFGGLRFYQRMEVKDVLAYFRLLLNPLDDISFERIINVPRRGIGDSSLAIIHQEAHDSGLSEYNYLLNVDPSSTELSSRALGALKSLIVKMETVKGKLTDNYETYSSVLKDFITEIGYYAYIADDEDVDEDRGANVNSLFDDITHFISHHPESTFDEYLQNVTLLTSQDDINEGNYVTLMTVHIAKGLEFDNVFVIAMNDGSFPSQRSELEGGNEAKEEERRLCYVAMTRAKKRLFMSCNSSYSYVTDTQATPSQFFEEAGIKLPSSEPSGGYYNRPYNGGGRSSWKNVHNENKSDFFGDGDSISPFENEVEDEVEEEPANNGVSDWKVGDIAHHVKFGDGVVTSIIDKTIIVVDFKEAGKKTLLANHPMLSRKASNGGEA